MKKIAIVSILMSLALVVTPALAFHSWNGYHWARTANPFTLKLGDNVSGDWDGYLGVASRDWTASAVLNTTIVAGQSKGNCQPTTGRVEVCSKTFGNNGWLGLAQVWITGGTHITKGAVKVNDTYFSTATYNNPNEKQHVICQEIGHTLGLGHQSEDGTSQDTCMDYFSNTGVNATSTLSIHPNAHDYEELAGIYAHLDGQTTIGADAPSKHGSSGSGIGANVDEASELGQSRGQDNKGRNNLFERDLGNGQKIITFVTWAE